MGHARSGPAEWADLGAIVDDIVSVRREIAVQQAHEARLLGRALDLALSRCESERGTPARRRSTADLPLREVSAELAAAMRLSDRSVQGRMGDATTLMTRFPATLAAWEAGRVDAGHVSAILDAGSAVPDGQCARFEALALAAAAHETPARLRAIARAQAAAIAPERVAERTSAAVGRRMVRLFDLDEGLSRIIADVPATLGHAMLDRLTQMARAVRDGEGIVGGECAPNVTGESAGGERGEGGRIGSDSVANGGGATSDGDIAGAHHLPGATVFIIGPGACSDDVLDRDPRTIDQLRADVLCDLVLAGTTTAHGDGLAAIAAHVQVTVPVLTLAGVSDEPALLAGSGPIDAETARRLAGGTPGWDRVLTHPYTGAVLAVDRYRWNRDLERFLAARDERCRFPGCRRTARRSDIDHTVDAARGGPTRHDNLAHLCRRHHTLKHETAWTVTQVRGGILQWRSPTARLYLDRPPATVRFVPDPGVGAAGELSRGDPPPF